MWRHCGVTLLATAALLGATSGQELPEGVQDGPCPIGPEKFTSLDWDRLTGTWVEVMRMKSGVQPNQCPTSNVYSGSAPNITVTLLPTLPDGKVIEIPRPGVIQTDNRKRLFSNKRPNPGFPDPNGLMFETIYTDYNLVHVFWTCHELEGNKNIHYAWIETREGNSLPDRLQKIVMWQLRNKGIDVSRFWRVGADLCKHCTGDASAGGH